MDAALEAKAALALKEQEIIAAVAVRGQLLSALFALEVLGTDAAHAAPADHPALKSFVLEHRIDGLDKTTLNLDTILLDAFHNKHSTPIINKEIADKQSTTNKRIERSQNPHLPTPTRLAPSAPARHLGSKHSVVSKYRKQKPSTHQNVNPALRGYANYAFQLRAQAMPLHSLLSSAPKVVSTRDWQLAREESKQLKVLARIDDLKSKNQWSLRQLKPAPTPKLNASQWDLLMEEMKWMSEDFRQERKWKIGMAYTLAQWVLEWHRAVDKSVVCIKPKPKLAKPIVQDVTMDEATAPIESTDPVSNPQPPPSTTTPLVNIEPPSEPTPTNSLILDAPPLIPEIPNASLSSSSSAPPPPPAAAPTSQPPPTFVAPLPKPTPSAPPPPPTTTTLPIHINFQKCIYTLSTPPPLHATLFTPSTTTYAPPALDAFPTPSSVAEEWEGVVPLSSLFTERYVAKEYSRWDRWGRVKADLGVEEEGEEEWVKGVGEEVAVVDFRDSPLFGKPAADPSLPAKPATPPVPPPPTLAKPSETTTKQIWVAEEDAYLLHAVHPTPTSSYNHNWTLISESLNTLKLGMRGETTRSEWDCFTRYTFLMDAARRGEVVGGGEVGRMGGRRGDVGKKFAKQLGVFEFVLARARVRQERVPKKPDPTQQRRVNLAAHDTHKQAQDNAGVNLSAGAEPLCPADLALMKEKREREFILHQQNQRMLNMQRMVPGMMPGSRPPFMQYPIPNPSAAGIAGQPLPNGGIPGFRPLMPMMPAPGGVGGPQQQPLPQQQLQPPTRLGSMGGTTGSASNGSLPLLQTSANTAGTANGMLPPQQPRMPSATGGMTPADQMMQMNNARRLMGLPVAAAGGAGGSPVPEALALQQQQFQQQMQQIQMARQMMQMGTGGAGGGGMMNAQQMAALLAMQSAQGRPQIPLDPRQLALYQQQHQMMASAMGGGQQQSMMMGQQQQQQQPQGSPGQSAIGLPGGGGSVAGGGNVGSPLVGQAQQQKGGVGAVGTVQASATNAAASPSAENKKADGGAEENAAAATATPRGSRSAKPSPAVKHANVGGASSNKRVATSSRSGSRKKKRVVESESEEEEELEEEDEEESEVEFPADEMEQDDDEEEEKPKRATRRESAAALAASTPSAPARRSHKRK
ncbi:chromatin modification- protein VID21 [Podochytrium sp. JEL0797]|nr:chromatin modification- protein VID21 [Podochytrium sp. JEL0797]